MKIHAITKIHVYTIYYTINVMETLFLLQSFFLFFSQTFCHGIEKRTKLWIQNILSKRIIRRDKNSHTNNNFSARN